MGGGGGVGGGGGGGGGTDNEHLSVLIRCRPAADYRRYCLLRLQQAEETLAPGGWVFISFVCFLHHINVIIHVYNLRLLFPTPTEEEELRL